MQTEYDHCIYMRRLRTEHWTDYFFDCKILLLKTVEAKVGFLLKNVDRYKLSLKLIRSVLGFGLLWHTRVLVGGQLDFKHADKKHTEATESCNSSPMIIYEVWAIELYIETDSRQ